MMLTPLARTLVLVAVCHGLSCAAKEKVELVALVGGTVYPSPEVAPITDSTVVVRDGVIEAVGPLAEVQVPDGAERVDCTGLHIVAGFQNSHVHFTEPKWEAPTSQPAELLSSSLEDMLLRFGFTTVVDVGSAFAQTEAIRRRISSGEVRGPRILTAGTPLYPENGIPYYLRDSLPAEVLAALHTPSTAAEAAAIVHGQIDAGADIVKLFVGSWVERGRVLPMKSEVARGAVRAAHERGKLAFAHGSNVAGLEVALEAGVDVLAHALDDDRGWNESHVERMKAAEMSMIPTLKLFGGQSYTKYILLEVRDWAEAGGQVLFGTDVGFLEDYDPAEEYALMSDSGLEWREILAALTIEPAKRFGESERRGRVVPGMEADLVVLAADPARSVEALADVRYTFRGGRLLYEAQ